MKTILATIAVACLDFELWWNERNYGNWKRWHNIPLRINSAVYHFCQPRSGRTFGTHDAPLK